MDATVRPCEQQRKVLVARGRERRGRTARANALRKGRELKKEGGPIEEVGLAHQLRTHTAHTGKMLAGSTKATLLRGAISRAISHRGRGRMRAVDTAVAHRLSEGANKGIRGGTAIAPHALTQAAPQQDACREDRRGSHVDEPCGICWACIAVRLGLVARASRGASRGGSGAGG